MSIKHILLLVCITLCLAIEQVEVDDFCRFLSSKDRNSPSKVEFVRPKKMIQGYVGQYKMKATQPIAEGEIVYAYSLRDDTINVENAKQDTVLGTLFTDLQANRNKTKDEFVLYDDQIIKLYLLHLKSRTDSVWTPYLKALPADVDIPLVWSDKELDELEGTSLHRFTKKLRDSLKRDFESFESTLKEKYPDHFGTLDYEAWKWASSIYNGRLWFKSKVFNPVLPLMEVFNLKESPSVKIEVDIETQTLKLIATEDIEQGEDVYISDGKLSNSDLLDYYGFVLPKNTEDSVEFGVGLNKEDKLYGNKLQLFKQRKLENGQSFKIKYSHIPEDFVYALRVYHLTVYDFEDVKNAIEDKVVSLQNELLVAQSIIDTARQYLAKFTTTLKEDKNLLERKDLSKRVKNAIILRRSEKRILARTLKTAKAILSDVKSKWDLRTMDVPGTDDFNNNLNIKEIM